MKSGALLIALACVAVPEAASARQDVRLDRQMFVERVSTDINGRARRVLERRPGGIGRPAYLRRQLAQ